MRDVGEGSKGIRSLDSNKRLSAGLFPEKMIPYSRQHVDIKDVIEIQSVLYENFLTGGPKVAEFEDAITGFCGAKYAVAFSSGTAALHAAYLTAEMKNHEVLTTPLTFVATANAMLYVGATPKFVDIETGSLCTHPLDYREHENQMVVPVHYAGRPLDLEPIESRFIIEDACHALGAVGRAGRVGNCAYSEMTVFSFHPTKVITTGEGGMVTTNSKEHQRRLIEIRNHGRFEGTTAQSLGYNYRLSDIHAALGVSQMRKLDLFLAQRSALSKRYRDRLGRKFFTMEPEWPEEWREFLRGTVSPQEEYPGHAYHLFVVRVPPDARDGLREHLAERGIGTQIHYPLVYHLPHFEHGDHCCPVAEETVKCLISLPLYPKLPEEVVDDVCKEMYLYLHDTWFRETEMISGAPSDLYSR